MTLANLYMLHVSETEKISVQQLWEIIKEYCVL